MGLRRVLEQTGIQEKRGSGVRVMPSQVERVGVVKRDYAGLRMRGATPEFKPVVEATMALSQERKLIQKGIFSIDLHGRDSWKYPGGEVVFSVYSRDPPFEASRPFNSGWFRNEIPVDLITGLRMLELAWKRAYVLREELKGQVFTPQSGENFK